MINSKPLGETDGSPPVGEKLEPETLELIALLLDELGPEGVDALSRLELAARDLRLVAGSDPKLLPALERADQLSQVKVVLKKILDAATGASDAVSKPIAAARSLGGAAMSVLPGGQKPIPEQKTDSSS